MITADIEIENVCKAGCHLTIAKEPDQKGNCPNFTSPSPFLFAHAERHMIIDFQQFL